MGGIDKLYHRSQNLPKRSNSKALTVDIAENIHLHYRDLRIEYSIEEYIHFMEHLNKMYENFLKWRESNPNWKESDPSTFDDENGVVFGKPKNILKEKSDYWDDRISIEKKTSGDYHIKWRNYRIEMDEKSFNRWIIAFTDVIPEFKKDTRLPKKARKFLIRMLKAIYRRIKAIFLIGTN